MKSTCKAKTVCSLTLTCVALTLILTHGPSYAELPQGISKYYHANIDLFSIQPNQALDSYVWYGSGGGQSNSSIGLACSDEFRNFSVDAELWQKDLRFFAKITVKPKGADNITQKDSFEVELTSLKPQSFKLAENNDGRLYMLNLSPNIEIVDNTPKRADDTSFNFGRWVLTGSMVIVNDEFYVGRMGVSGGHLAFVDISQIGRFEFALKPFRNAKLLGTLKDGKISIHCEDGNTIEIYNVKNGVHEIQLPGGPYEVWVRRHPPTETREYVVPDEDEWIRQVKANFAERDATPPSDGVLKQQYKVFKSKKRHFTLASGVGPIKPNDRIE